ncbi:MAG: hypothetical protein ABFD89_26255 [Bryobacteraceae bacterium]
MKDLCDDEIPLKRTSRQGAGRPKKESVPAPRIPRVTRLMALAIKFQDLVDRGEVSDYAELARLGFVTRARLTQIMNLLLLSPQMQEDLIQSGHVSRNAITESALRLIAKEVHWPDQGSASLQAIPPAAKSAVDRRAPWPKDYKAPSSGRHA